MLCGRREVIHTNVSCSEQGAVSLGKVPPTAFPIRDNLGKLHGEGMAFDLGLPVRRNFKRQRDSIMSKQVGKRMGMGTHPHQ